MLGKRGPSFAMWHGYFNMPLDEIPRLGVFTKRLMINLFIKNTVLILIRTRLRIDPNNEENLINLNLSTNYPAPKTVQLGFS